MRSRSISDYNLTDSNEEESKIEATPHRRHSEGDIYSSIEIYMGNPELTREQFGVYSQLREMGFEVDGILQAINRGAFDVESAIDIINSGFSLLISGDQQSDNILPIPRACPICDGEFSQLQQMRLPECGHWFCKECVTQYIQVRVNDNLVLSMPCPDFSCNANLPESLVTELLSGEMLEKYNRFKREAELSSNANLRWCPKPDCQGYDIGGTRKKRLICNVCSCNFCYYCTEEWLEDHKKCKGVVDYQLDEWSRKNNVKHCPNCKRRVQKMEGCDHMTCLKCRYEWCWLCGAKYHPNHYQECEFQKIKRKEFPWPVILCLLFAPVLWPFAFIIIAFRSCERTANQRDTKFRKFVRNRVLSVPTIFVVALILTPLVFVFGLLFSGVAFLLELGTHLGRNHISLRRLVDNDKFWIPFSIIIGISGTPLVAAIGAVLIVLAHFAGLGLMLYKLYLAIRKRYDPNFMNPASGYGNY